MAKNKDEQNHEEFFRHLAWEMAWDLSYLDVLKDTFKHLKDTQINGSFDDAYIAEFNEDYPWQRALIVGDEKGDHGGDNRMGVQHIGNEKSKEWRRFSTWTRAGRRLVGQRLVEKIVESSKAVAALVTNDEIKDLEKGWDNIPRLNDRLRSKGMPHNYKGRFYDNRSIGFGTAFLVKENLLVTAGHNLWRNRKEIEVPDFSIVFDYHRDKKNNLPDLSSLKIFKPKAVKAHYYPDRHLDIGLITLDRPVKFTAPLECSPRSNQRDLRGEDLYTIGHPLGLHKIFSPNGKMYLPYKHGKSFICNLDTYRGNSGSPILNQKTQKIEGILLGGAPDFELKGTTYWNRRYRHWDLVRGISGERCQDVLELKKLIKIP